MYHISTMVWKTLINLIQGVMDVYLLVIPLLVRHIVYTPNIPRSLSNLFMLSLTKLTTVLVVHLHFDKFKSNKYVDNEDEGALGGYNQQCAPSNADQSPN